MDACEIASKQTAKAGARQTDRRKDREAATGKWPSGIPQAYCRTEWVKKGPKGNPLPRERWCERERCTPLRNPCCRVSDYTFRASYPVSFICPLGPPPPFKPVPNSHGEAVDLMNPALPNGLRRTISADDQGMLEEAYRYQMAPDPNGDGVVNFSDLLMLAQHYGQTNANFTQGDFNGDGTVNFSDLLMLAQHYGQTLASGPGLASFVSVPEPVALGVVVWACAVVFRRRETSQKARMAANPMMPAMRIGLAA